MLVYVDHHTVLRNKQLVRLLILLLLQEAILNKVVCLCIIALCFYRNTQVRATYMLKAEIYYLSFRCIYIVYKLQETKL